ncbi:hypothetical protein HYW20_01795 [Candidatus Woesearchaeota archaeon]|nr:hypothetical protein [Candidatus Woesearchaeota archaeon]
MKKLFGYLAMFLIMAGYVLATNLVLDPDLVTMGTTDVEVVDACLSQSGGAPWVGADLIVETYCRDLNSNEVCDAVGDITFPAGFSAVVTSTPTDATGCGKVTLTTSSATPGTYAYKVNGMTGATVVASEHGLVLVPEFTTIGAGLVLAGAGYYMYRKRSRK